MAGCAGHTDSVEAVVFSNALPLLVTGAIDGRVLIWDVANLTLRGACNHPEVCKLDKLLHAVTSALYPIIECRLRCNVALSYKADVLRFAWPATGTSDECFCKQM